MNFTLNKREFRDAIKLRYGCEFNDIPTVCVCGGLFDAGHALTRGWISVRGAPGRDNILRSLMLGFVTLTQTHTRTSPRSRFTSFMRMIKSAFTRLEGLR